jgi:hypothetical protein
MKGRTGKSGAKEVVKESGQIQAGLPLARSLHRREPTGPGLTVWQLSQLIRLDAR